MNAVRSRADRCPGVLRLHEAADGFLARLRFPGGFVTPDALRVLAAATAELGDGRLELTSRGNLQVRGLDGRAADELTQRAFTAGLVPSIAHDEVRNVVASPLAGLDRPGGLRDVVAALDRAVLADPVLAGLTGRFLFGLDDGRGDIAALRPDALAVLDGEHASVEGLSVRRGDVPARLVDVAHAFLDERNAQGSGAWRVAELDGGRARLRARLGAPPADVPPVDAPTPAAPALPIGRVARADGGYALVVAPPLGRLSAEQAHWLADHAGGDELRITTSRRIVLPSAPDPADPAADPASVGLVVDPTSPWLTVSACAGRPRCAGARADVQTDAARSLGRWPGRRVHWSGCARRCGRTADVQVDVVATADGYEIETTDA